jgi:hypothetical protein
MVADDPESFADLDGHITNASQGSRDPMNGGPTCAAGGAGGTGSANSASCGAGQTANQTEDQQQAEATKQQAQNLKGPYVADLKSPEIAPLLDPNHKSSNSDIVGNGECVTACKKFAGLEGTSTDQWRAGPKVVDDKDIKPGTAIATFDDKGHYPGKDQNKNSAIYLGRGTNGSIWVLDQWPARPGTTQKAHPPQPRELRPGGTNVSNNSNAYYVILVAPR